jgi:class 3 adenylate cyclase
VYPTQEFEEDHATNSPIMYTLAVAFVFLFAISVFFVYDFFVERRQTKVMATATKSSAIVNSLFPANVRDRLMEEQDSNEDKKFTAFKALGQHCLPNSRPIADHFPETTVMFADIAGFTAWSSLREPSQVFILLESVYNAFDKIAKKMKVFKVETIG